SQKGVELPVADLAASFRKAVVDCLVQNFQKAAEDFHCTTLVTAGGVSANSLLRSRLEALCGERGWKLYMPPKELCGDNAAMVGAQGFYEWKAGNRAGLNLNACATMSIEG
ncbi:MAG: tRNA (adenosine(37)-N6)-threonylcarbamoyltransferase complex transferase subunit TsaD, partial [[Clostridium] leptum]